MTDYDGAGIVNTIFLLKDNRLLLMLDIYLLVRSQITRHISLRIKPSKL